MKQENLSTTAMEVMIDYQGLYHDTELLKLMMVIADKLDISSDYWVKLLRDYADMRFGYHECDNIDCDKLVENMRRLKETCDSSHSAISELSIIP